MARSKTPVSSSTNAALPPDNGTTTMPQATGSMPPPPNAAANSRPGKQRPAPRRVQVTLWQRFATVFGVLIMLILLGAGAGVGYVDWLFYQTAKDLPAADKLIDYQPGGITEIYATDKDPKTGKHILLGRLYLENKQFEAVPKIPKLLQDATVSIEDERFYSHTGIDPRGILRAVYRDIKGGKLEEGASTLTQQLARNVYLTQARTFGRKAKEIMLAIQLEKNFSKQQILEMYLNEVYYGSNAYGVKAAAQEYFGKPLAKLTLAECALIAGLPQRPNDLQPRENPEAAINRRNIVIGKMLQLGHIKPAQAKTALVAKLKLAPVTRRNQDGSKAPHFVEYIRNLLVEKYGVEKVYKSGLRVYTTLNWKMQQEAERALINGVLYARRDRVTEGALVAIEPRSGYIRAMVGGVDFQKEQYNNAVQGRRQPGSAFKPFIYTTAFETRRYDSNSSVNDNTQRFWSGGKWYQPKNYGGNTHGWVSIRQAVIHSYNIAAVSLCHKVGATNVRDLARKVGITLPDKVYLPVALGAYEVSPLEIASAYSTFPNGGNHSRAMGIIRVLDQDGYALENNTPTVNKAVISEYAVAEMGSILRDVVLRGTASKAKGIQEVPNAHGKTGTTNDNRDAWFVGYTPELSTAVWVCGVRKQKNKPTVYVQMDSVTGGAVCAPIWARFMNVAIPIQKAAGLPKIPPARRITNPMADATPPLAAASVSRRTNAPAETAPNRPPRERQQAMQETGTGATASATTGVSAIAALAPVSPNRPASAPVNSAAAGVLSSAVVAASASDPRGSVASVPSPASARSGARVVVSPPRVFASPPSPTAAVPLPPRAVASPPRGIASPPPRVVAAPSSPLPRALPVSQSPPVVVASVPGTASARIRRARAASTPPPSVAVVTPRLIAVGICADSSQKATRYCPETYTNRYAAGRVPGRFCRLHRPQPGEGN